MAKRGWRYVAEYGGERFTRTSARIYTHAVVIDDASGAWVWSFCGSETLAVQQAAKARRTRSACRVEIVPVKREG